MSQAIQSTFILFPLSVQALFDLRQPSQPIHEPLGLPLFLSVRSSY